MSLRLYPSDSIQFERPLTRMGEQEMRLENVGKQPLLFKVKTNSPKSFCVRPNVGHINPLSTVTVKVYRQPLKVEPPLDKYFDDKFLILSTPSTSTSPHPLGSLHKLWANIEGTEKGQITKYKIRCEYGQPPASSPQQPPPSYTASLSPTVHHSPSSPSTSTEAPPSYNAFSETSHQLSELQKMLDSYKQEISGLRHRDPKVNQERCEEAEVENEGVIASPLPQPRMRPIVEKARGETGYPIQVIVLVAMIAFALGCLALSLHK